MSAMSHAKRKVPQGFELMDEKYGDLLKGINQRFAAQKTAQKAAPASEETLVEQLPAEHTSVKQASAEAGASARYVVKRLNVAIREDTWELLMQLFMVDRRYYRQIIDEWGRLLDRIVEDQREAILKAVQSKRKK